MNMNRINGIMGCPWCGKLVYCWDDLGVAKWFKKKDEVVCQDCKNKIRLQVKNQKELDGLTGLYRLIVIFFGMLQIFLWWFMGLEAWGLVFPPIACICFVFILGLIMQFIVLHRGYVCIEKVDSSL
jgi:hypothetical protein